MAQAEEGPTALHIELVRLARPQLLIAPDSRTPDLPALPTTELVLHDASPLRGYLGEEFVGAVVVRSGPAAPSGAQPVRVNAKVRGSDGSMKDFTAQEHELSDKNTAEEGSDKETSAGSSVLFPVSFNMTYPGKWQLAAAVEVEHELEKEVVQRVFDIDVRPAVSIRFKISRSSTQVAAHVLEAQVENLSTSVLTIESCELAPRNGWTVQDLAPADPPAVLLRPHEVYQYCFVLRGGSSSEAGPLVVGWRREPLGAKGWQTTAAVRI